MRAHLLLIPAVALVATACNAATATPTEAPEPGDTPPPTVQQVEGRVVSLDEGGVVVDLLEITSHPSAPNDVVIIDPTDDTVAWALDEGLVVTMLDCRMACEPAEVPAEDWIDGTARPYGGAEAVYRFVVEGDTLREVLEVYLP